MLLFAFKIVKIYPSQQNCVVFFHYSFVHIFSELVLCKVLSDLQLKTNCQLPNTSKKQYNYVISVTESSFNALLTMISYLFVLKIFVATTPSLTFLSSNLRVLVSIFEIYNCRLVCFLMSVTVISVDLFVITASDSCNCRFS